MNIAALRFYAMTQMTENSIQHFPLNFNSALSNILIMIIRARNHPARNGNLSKQSVKAVCRSFSHKTAVQPSI